MTRTTNQLAALSSSLMLAVFVAGCGGSSPASSGKGGHDGGSDAATGAAGAAAGAPGTGGDNGTAGAAGDNGTGGSPAGTGGATAGAGGSMTGTGGASGGAAGSTAGAGGGTAGKGGAGGASGAGGGTAGTGAGGAKADGGTDAAPTPCTVGGTCADGFTCTNARGCGPNREQFCFCDPNGKVACEGCSAVDAGTDAGTALKMCPADVMNHNAACTMNGERCAANACTNSHQDVCICAVFGGAMMGHWFCANLACQ